MPSDFNSIGRRLHASGWKSGCVLSADHCQRLPPLQRAGEAPYQIQPDDWLIVVSQTCDVVAPKLAQEPYVEVLLAQQRSGIDSTKSGLKSTRYLSFRATPSGQALEARATDRFWVPREALDDQSPDTTRTISAGAIRRIGEWFALRYTRAAWPESLVKRLRPIMEDVERILSDVALEVVEVRVAITDIDKELPESIDYNMTVFGVADPDVCRNDPEQRGKCLRVFQELLSKLRSCQGIVVKDDSDLVLGDDFDWQTTRMTHQWDFANLTDAARPD